MAIALAAFGLAGCAKHPQDKAAPPSKVYDLGVLDVANGVQTTRDLGDGRVCVITPAFQKNGSVRLNMKLEESGKVLTQFRAEFSGHTTSMTMRIGNFSISFSPHVEK